MLFRSVKSPQDHPYMNQRVTGKVRQAFLLSIGRTVGQSNEATDRSPQDSRPFRHFRVAGRIHRGGDAGTTEDFQLSDSELKQRLATILAADVAGEQAQP